MHWLDAQSCDRMNLLAGTGTARGKGTMPPSERGGMWKEIKAFLAAGSAWEIPEVTVEELAELGGQREGQPRKPVASGPLGQAEEGLGAEAVRACPFSSVNRAGSEHSLSLTCASGSRCWLSSPTVQMGQLGPQTG